MAQLARKLHFTPSKVLVVQKRTRLVRETLRHPCYLQNLHLAGRRDDLKAIQRRHDIHETNLSVILRELQGRFKEVRLVDQINQGDLDWADLYVSAGGDGTFLNVASHLVGGKWVVGLNTDPDRSVGHLCVRSKHTTNLKYIIKQLADGNCTLIKRYRIRVTLTYPSIGDNNAEVEIPKFALNDVYIGETSPTRLSYLELSIDDIPTEKQKSSGFLISTGSGSTAWGYHCNALDFYRTEQLNHILSRLGLLNKKLSNSEIGQIMNRFNDSFIFSPADARMKYVTREPLQNNVFKSENTQGWADSITIRSLCWKGMIVMDGVQREFNFDDGVIAKFTTNDMDSINSVQFVD